MVPKSILRMPSSSAHRTSLPNTFPFRTSANAGRIAIFGETLATLGEMVAFTERN